MTQQRTCSPPKRRVGRIARVALLAALAVGLILAAQYFNVRQAFRDALAWIEAAGPSALSSSSGSTSRPASSCCPARS